MGVSQPHGTGAHAPGVSILGSLNAPMVRVHAEMVILGSHPEFQRPGGKNRVLVPPPTRLSTLRFNPYKTLSTILIIVPNPIRAYA